MCRVIHQAYALCSTLFNSSERVSKSGVAGKLLTEAKYINLSLHHLEHVRGNLVICRSLLSSPCVPLSLFSPIGDCVVVRQDAACSVPEQYDDHHSA